MKKIGAEITPCAKEVVTIESVAYGGAGVGKWSDGRICFVHGTIPGDVVEVAPQTVKARFIKCHLPDKFISLSPARIKVECPYYPQCPGCNYLSLPYKSELQIKQKQLIDFLVRRSWITPDKIADPIPAHSRFGLRNKIKLVASHGTWGYHAWDNVSILPIAKCPLAHAEINHAIANTPAPFNGEGTWRYTENDGVICNGGKKLLTETMGSFGNFKVPFNSFFQTNLSVAAILAQKVKDLIFQLEVKNVLELYCGVGVFSLIIAMNSDIHCHGIELDPQAIAAAKLNAQNRKLSKQCLFTAANANNAINSIKDLSQMAVIIDPPRTGVDQKVIRQLCAARSKGIIYISCAADTLCRDAGCFAAHNYRLQSAQLLDMFPGTAHFELLTLFQPS